MAIRRLPKGLVVGINGTHGSFGLTGGTTLMPGDLAVSFPQGRSLDADFQIQVDSNSELQGGVEPDSYVPVDSSAVEDMFGSNIDIVLSYAEQVLDSISSVDSSGPPSTAGARLIGCYPNPFNPKTTIEYVVSSEGPVRLTVFDARGRQVRVLADEPKQPGSHTVTWDGRDQDGHLLASGVYFHRIEASGVAQIGKMVLVK